MMLLLAVVGPSLEYGNERWECNKGQANAILLGVNEELGIYPHTQAFRGLDTRLS